MTATLPITPETKVADLLEAYPALETLLIELSPHFSALKNPTLRRTVARVATLAKAAEMGGIPIRRLILTLRQAAGQEAEDASDVSPDSPTAIPDVAPPDWLDLGRIRETIDAEALLAAGEHPVGRVQRTLRELADGELLCLTSSFRPIPLIELLAKAGHRTHVQEESPARYRTYVTRGQSPAA